MTLSSLCASESVRIADMNTSGSTKSSSRTALSARSCRCGSRSGSFMSATTYFSAECFASPACFMAFPQANAAFPMRGLPASCHDRKLVGHHDGSSHTDKGIVSPFCRRATSERRSSTRSGTQLVTSARMSLGADVGGSARRIALLTPCTCRATATRAFCPSSRVQPFKGFLMSKCASAVNSVSANTDCLMLLFTA